jgi:5-methylcytosine-specific restriction protein A
MADWPYCWPWPKVSEFVLKRDGYVCQIQGPKCTKVATESDHIIPPDEGGAPFDSDNARASCAACNRARGAARMHAMAKLNRQNTPDPSRNWSG